MAAVWFRLRAELRSRWKAVLAVGLVAGVAGAVTLATAAGVRRGHTSFERFRTATNAPDVLVNPDAGTDSGLDDHAVAALPEVEQAGRIDGIAVFDLRARRAVSALNSEVFVSRGQAFYSVARGKYLDGRPANRHRADEAMVNRAFARRFHVGVGDTWHGVVITDFAPFATGAPDDAFLREVRAGGHRDVASPVSLRITGVYVDATSLIPDQAFDEPQIALTPSFGRRHHPPVLYWGSTVRLRPGTRLADFEHHVDKLPHQGSIAYQTLAATRAKVDRAIKPQTGALTVFAVVVGLIGLLVVGQTLARQIALDAHDHPTLSALGFGRRQLFGLALARTVPAAAIGSMVAVVGAYLLSPTMPIGVARLAEPHPGLDFDPRVLLTGGLAVFVAALLLAAIPAWRAATVAHPRAARHHRVAKLVGRVGAPPVTATGVRMALDPGAGSAAVPVRTTITSALAAVAALTAAVVVATSLGHLVSTPTLYGWNWDATVEASGDAGSTGVGSTAYFAARTERALRRDHAVARWARFDISTMPLDGHPVTTVGKAMGTTPRFVIANGRRPRTGHEIALGSRTMHTLGVGIGDHVRATDTTGRPVSMEVVGRVVLPALGTYTGSDKTSPGEGAFVTAAALGHLAPRFDSHQYVFDFRAGASRSERSAALARIRRAAQSEDTGSRVPEPSDIVAYREIRSTPTLLAVALAALAVLTLAHGVISSVRRRRYEFALLKTMGFTRRQVSAAVSWQASTMVLVALAIGIPIGIVGGRWAWTALADDLGTVADPLVPAVALIAGVLVVLLVANVVAYVPGRSAGRVRPALTLRSE